jgi:spermidine/putrescine transport system ATP-binding protein
MRDQSLPDASTSGRVVSASPSIVELVGVSKSFGEVSAVDDISLSVRKGEFLSIIGPSGCGKTTTLRMIAGFEHPTSGRILLDGKPVDGIPPYRRNVNTVFQQYALFPHMSVFDNIAFGPRRRGRKTADIEARAAAMLETVGLVGYGKRMPDQLSGGEQQRVALARALINEPAVLLLDEPLGALDLKVRKRMQIELKRIHAEVGVTFLYVTHDQEEAMAMSDRVAVMNRGRIEQIDTTTAIYERPRTRYVADFVGESNVLRGAVVGDEGDALSIAVGPLRLVAAADAERTRRGDVEVRLRPEKIRVARTAPTASENVFEGRLREAVFQGPNIRYVIALAPDVDVVVCCANQAAFAAGAMFAPGDTVHVAWERAVAMVFAADGK